MRIYKHLFLFSIAILVSLELSAQNFKLQGILLDKADNSPLVGAVVIVSNASDTTKKYFSTTELEGDFVIKSLSNGTYFFKTFYTGYSSMGKTVVIENADVNLGIVKLAEVTQELKEVVIVTKQERVVQKGDTTDYNANAYKVNPDANVEDLIKKMPGITVENGVVKSQGEAVQKVLVDGKEFFGEDATMALKNLPADVVERIQTFDRASDQAQFTGFDDGNNQKTINIVTKSKNVNGQFGRIYAGYGTDDRYQLGGNMNFFKGNQRISVMGLANNINQQNFSSQDLQGTSSSGGRQGGGGGQANNFMTGQQAGINTTNSFGLNYSDKWGKRIAFTGSYFYNNIINNTNSIVNRNYFLSDTSSQIYNAATVQESNSYNHRLNGRLEYTIDSANSLILTPVLSFQNSGQQSQVAGQNALSSSELLNRTKNGSNADNAGYAFSNSLLYKHKFKKDRRTISFNFKTDVQRKSSTNALVSQNDYYSVNGDSTKLIDQVSQMPVNAKTLGADINYTEPLGKKGGIQLSYSPSYTQNYSDKATNSLNNQGDYVFDTILSNKYTNEVNTQKMGLGYRFKDVKTNFAVGANYQYLHLNGDQEFPRAVQIQKSFENILPNAFFNYKHSKSKNLRIMYRTNTNTPSIAQLQNVINNANPVSLSTGNPNLLQEYSHNFTSRYSMTNAEKARNFMWMLGGTYTANAINNSTFTAEKDTVINNYLVYKGTQLTAPVNLNGALNARTFLTYGMPVTKIKSNLNLNSGLTYTRTPGQINNRLNYSNALAFVGGFVLGSNISPKIDFAISYTGNYTIVDNSIQPTLNNNYYYQTSGIKANWLPWKGFVLATDLTHSYYLGLAGNAFNQNYWLWNAGLGYKFLKNQAGELKLSVFDLLGQNTSVNRTVANTYIEDNRTLVLTRYFMLTFTYTLKNITGNLPAPSDTKQERRERF